MTAPAIPPRVRRAVIDILRDYDISERGLVRSLGRTHGFRSVEDLLDALEATHGKEMAEAVGRAVVLEIREGSESGIELFSAALRQAARSQQLAELADATNFADSVMASIPDDWFAEAVGIGTETAVAAADLEVVASVDAAVAGGIERLFERTGVPYRLTDEFRPERVGEPTAAAHAIQPALSRLDDPRLATTKRHFEAALRGFRGDDPRDAVDEARQAVEAGMLAFIDDSDEGERPAKNQGNELFKAAVKAGLPKHSEELVLGAVRLRGRTTAGHPGTHEVTPLDAEAAIASAAASLLYLAGHLS